MYAFTAQVLKRLQRCKASSLWVTASLEECETMTGVEET